MVYEMLSFTVSVFFYFRIVFIVTLLRALCETELSALCCSQLSLTCFVTPSGEVTLFNLSMLDGCSGR